MPGERRKLSILLPDLGMGGAERVSLVLAREFARAGLGVEFVLLRAEGELLDEARAAYSVTALNVDRMRDAFFPLGRYIRGSKPDVLFVSMWPLTSIAAFVAKASRRNAKVLIVDHAVLSAQYADRGLMHRLLMRVSMAIGYRLADVCVGVSCGVTADQSALAMMAPSRFRVINNPVTTDAEIIDGDTAVANAYWGACNGARILTVGRLKEEKNQALLIRAFALACKETDACLMLVGAGRLGAELRELALELGVEKRVIFAGWQEDTGPFYRSADIFVLSSSHEGFANVILEALANGIPVVSTDCPSGPAEILENGKFGRLVVVGDEYLLAQAILEQLANEHDAEVLRHRAADFAPQKVADRYLDLMM